MIPYSTPDASCGSGKTSLTVAATIVFGCDVSTDNISCIDHEIMDFYSETPFWSSMCDIMFWILCFDLG